MSVTPADVPPPKVEVLRRASILRLVQEAPKEKYDALKPFIDISLVEQAESVLRKQYKDSGIIFNDIANRIAENSDTLDRLYKESGSLEASALVWAAKTIKNPPQDHSKDVTALRDVAKAIDAITSAKEELATATAELATANKCLDEANGSVLTIEVEAMTDDAEFERILSVARDHFAMHPVGDSCPLCQSAERVGDLADRVNQRLEKLTTLTAARENAHDAKSKHDSKLSVADSVSSRTKALAATAKEKIATAPLEWSQAHSSLSTDFQSLAQHGNTEALSVDVLERASESAIKLCS